MIVTTSKSLDWKSVAYDFSNWKNLQKIVEFYLIDEGAVESRILHAFAAVTLCTYKIVSGEREEKEIDILKIDRLLSNVCSNTF